MMGAAKTSDMNTPEVSKYCWRENFLQVWISIYSNIIIITMFYL